jgi:hypothetical protein
MNGGTGVKNQGMVVLAGLILVTGIIALLAYAATGPMGIEERFRSATGSGYGDSSEEGGAGFAGFTLEGHPVLYGVILLLLLTGCWGAYRKFGT